LEKALEDAQRQASEDQFWATRGKAVQAYARLEQALCRVFADVSSMSQDIAAIVFFRIASASARNDILDKLIRRRHGSKYNYFWNSIFKSLRPIDNKRNEIVHWAVTSEVQLGVHDVSVAPVTLKPPTYWSTLDSSAPQITNDGLLEFIQKCDFYSRIFNAFSAVTADDAANSLSEEIIDAWLDIFRKPLVYPPPEDSPLAQSLTEPDTPP
jgi:hypothetical protein